MAKRVKTDPELLKQRAAKVREISEKVYKMRLEMSCHGGTERMLAEDNDGGRRLSGRAGAYDILTRCYMEALGIEL